MPEPPDEQYPLLLLTGRGSVSQWHTQTRTRQSAVLRKLYPGEAYVEIHPDDAGRWAFAAATKSSSNPAAAASRCAAVLSRSLQPGQVFLPMHYAIVNRLTLPHFDPHSRQPSYKDCAVRLIPARAWEPAR